MFPDFLKTKEKLQKMLDGEMQKARLTPYGTACQCSCINDF